MKLSDSTVLPVPVRTSTTDRPEALLHFAIEAFSRGPVALATLVEIHGGAARALGSHVVVDGDGRFCGYVSGGCVEAAVAAEALAALSEGRDRLVKFGQDSPFFDIALPCGGGISVAIHLLREVEPLREVLDCLEKRTAAALTISHGELSATCGPAKTGWSEERFTISYRPPTRLLISGRAAEVEMLTTLADVSGYDVVDGAQLDAGTIDPLTAVVLLHHDLDAEAAVLKAALKSPAFYIGALGSTRTHHVRVTRLADHGFTKLETDRIRAPIGLFGPTRDLTSLSISVLADVAACRLAAIG